MGVVSTNCNFNRQLTHACNLYYVTLRVSSNGVEDTTDEIVFFVDTSGPKNCSPCPVSP